MSAEIDRARAALDQARADHAAAMVAKISAPSPDAARRLAEAERRGREAWKGYREEATAGLAGQIAALVPGSFLE